MLDLRSLTGVLPGSISTILLVFLSLVIYLVSRTLYYRLAFAINFRHQCPAGHEAAPAYPSRDPILGADLLFRMYKAIKSNRLIEEFTLRYDEVLPNATRKVHTYSSVLLGNTIVFTREAENIKTVLSTNFKDWGLPDLRKKVLSKEFGEGIFSADGHAWEKSRAMLRPNFKRSEFGDLSFLEHHARALISRIEEDSEGSGKTVDLQELFPLLTLDSVTELLFGKSTNSLSANGDVSSGQEFKEAFNYTSKIVALKMRSPLSGRLPDKKFRWAVNFVNDFLSRFVDEALRLRHEKLEKDGDDEEAKDGERYVFLQELAKSDYSAEKIKVELLSIMVAGRDTTAALLSILWYELAHRPEIVQRLRDEITALNGEAPTLEQLKGLKYLRWTINEVLRLHPIVPLNSRTALKNTTLPTGGGPTGTQPIFIPAGQRIVWSTYGLHRRKDLYGDDAEEFKPERWESLRPGWDYIPFSGGPRICIGQQLALNEAGYTTVRMLQAFPKLECRDEMPWEEVVGLIVTSKHGCQVGLSRN